MREIIELNQDWIFVDNDKKSLAKAKAMPKSYEKVNLPHAFGNNSVTNPEIPQATVWYRKDFYIEPRLAGKIIFLEFQGVMSECEIFLNGKKIAEHKGGYTPIVIEVTEVASFGKANNLAVKVTNKSDPLILPGVPLNKSEYQYFGGIYRNVLMVVKEEVHITETNYESAKGEGVYLYDETIVKNLAVLATRVEVANMSNRASRVTVTSNIYDRQGRLKHIYTSPEVIIKPDKSESIEVTSRVDSPKFWSPYYPYLYKVEFVVSSNGGIVDSVEKRHGFRTVRADHRGFILNGRRTMIRGTNRVQQYPYLGMAVGDTAEFRDAYKIKRAGFNAVRLIGGGNSSGFLDACDELGIMVINCIPSQQFCARGEFLDNTVKAVRDMARRDRNHTSVVVWEPFLSETGVWEPGASDKFFLECKEALIGELSQGVPPLIAGDTIGRKEPKILDCDLPYCEHDKLTLARHLKSLPGRKSLVKGYGDYEFGEEDSLSRVDRISGEKAMLLQAWNFQWSHNRNMNSRGVVGDLLWSNVDYLSPSSPKNPVCKAGIMDMFRLPKYSYYFFKAQDIRPSQRMVFIPSFWDDDRVNALPIYSNCEKVRLYINGKYIGEQEPSGGVFEDFLPGMASKKKATSIAEGEISSFWAKGALDKAIKDGNKLSQFVALRMFNGNNGNRIKRPPFIFNELTYEPGEVKAEGIINGEVVATHIVRTPDAPIKLSIKPDYSSKALINDGEDFIFCYISVIDKYGIIVPNAKERITCEVTGATFIGDSVVNVVEGVAVVMIKADRNVKNITLKAIGNNLEECVIDIIVDDIENAGIDD